MFWIWRVFLWFFCAEWLLVLRVWMSPRVIVLLVFLGALRSSTLFLVTPAWSPYAYAYRSAIAFGIIARLYGLLTGRSNRMRARRQVIEAGAPWLSAFAGHPVFTHLVVEPLAALALVLFLVSRPDSRLIMPQWGYVKPYLDSVPSLYPYAQLWDTWVRAAPEQFANFVPLVTVLAFFLANCVEMLALRQPKEKPVTESYAEVRLHEHATPALPSVKALAEDLAASYLHTR